MTEAQIKDLRARCREAELIMAEFARICLADGKVPAALVACAIGHISAAHDQDVAEGRVQVGEQASTPADGKPAARKGRVIGFCGPDASNGRPAVQVVQVDEFDKALDDIIDPRD